WLSRDAGRPERAARQALRTATKGTRHLAQSLQRLGDRSESRPGHQAMPGSRAQSRREVELKESDQVSRPSLNRNNAVGLGSMVTSCGKPRLIHQSRRDCALQPKVAERWRGYLGSNRTKDFQPQSGCATSCVWPLPCATAFRFMSDF